MTYVDGFLAPVPEGNRAAFLDHARRAAPLFREFGATRSLDSWGDQVPAGEVTDFYRAVDARAGETVSFGFMEYPDRAARDAAVAAMMSDPRISELPPMPFDGQRMIFSGFELVVDERREGRAGYIEGFVAAVPHANKDRFVEHSLSLSPLFLEHGALRHVEGWGDDVMRGKITDFWRAVKAGEDETVIFSWLEWPDKATRDAGQNRLMPTMMDRMRDDPMPFDGRRMIFGGFEVLHDERD